MLLCKPVSRYSPGLRLVHQLKVKITYELSKEFVQFNLQRGTDRPLENPLFGAQISVTETPSAKTYQGNVSTNTHPGSISTKCHCTGIEAFCSRFILQPPLGTKFVGIWSPYILASVLSHGADADCCSGRGSICLEQRNFPERGVAAEIQSKATALLPISRLLGGRGFLVSGCNRWG